MYENPATSLVVVKPEEAVQVAPLEENIKKSQQKDPIHLKHRCALCPCRLTFYNKNQVLEHLKKW